MIYNIGIVVIVEGLNGGIWDEIRSVAVWDFAGGIVVVDVVFEPVFELEEDPFAFFIAAEVFQYPGELFEIDLVEAHVFCHLLG